MRKRIPSATGTGLRARIHSCGARVFRAAADDAGSALVEFGLTAALFFAVILGIVTFSLAAYSYLFVSDAAREGTRYAMVRGDSQGTDCTAPGPANCIAQPADIQTYVRDFAFPGVNSGGLNVSSTWLTGSGGSCGTGDSCKVVGNQVQVKVTYSLGSSLPLVPAQAFNFSSTSQVMIAH